MLQILINNPILLLFLVASIGYLIGSIKVGGSSLGVAAVLFTGLAFGAIDERLHIPEILLLIGLAIFVYSLGLSSGPAFFKSYKKNGFKDFIFIISMLVLSAFFAIGMYFAFGFSGSTATGIYCGSTTNTAALAGVIDLIGTDPSQNQIKNLTEEAVIGYSFSYPMGVLGGMIAIVLMEKWLKIDYKQEANLLKKDFPVDGDLTSRTILVTNSEIADIQMRLLLKDHNWNLNFGRVHHQGKQSLVGYDSTFHKGDLVMVIGSREDIDKATDFLGKEIDHPLSFDRSYFDVRRIFVSNPKLIGKSLSSLNLSEKFDATITRIRRGDIDMLATSNMVLEMGDRIRFIARREDLKEISDLFGDSYKQSSQVNLFSFGLGIGLGVILGTIKIPLSADITFSLGYAGGPLIVGLLLGALRRTGPINWTLPYSANVTLQQFGLILLLSAIGVRSGNALVDNLSMEGFWIFIASAIISLLTAISILYIGYKWLKRPFSILMGMVANQPAILDFGASRSENNIPAYGYTMIFPIALILKIVIAQLMFIILH